MFDGSLARRSTYAELGPRSRRCWASAGEIVPKDNKRTAKSPAAARLSITFPPPDRPLLFRPLIQSPLAGPKATGQREIVTYVGSDEKMGFVKWGASADGASKLLTLRAHPLCAISVRFRRFALRRCLHWRANG